MGQQCVPTAAASTATPSRETTSNSNSIVSVTINALGDFEPLAHSVRFGELFGPVNGDSSILSIVRNKDIFADWVQRHVNTILSLDHSADESWCDRLLSSSCAVELQTNTGQCVTCQCHIDLKTLLEQLCSSCSGEF